MAPGKAEEGKLCIDRLRAFQRSNQANKRCANCPERGPTYVCLDFQIFVCQQCSGLHRGFGHKIKSISLSEWSLAEVAKIEKGGNQKSADMYLHRYNKEATTNPEPESSDVEAVREFIKAKFVDKKWFRPHSATPEPEKTQAPAAAVAAVPSTTSAPAATALSGACGYAAAAPRPPQAAQAPMMDLLSGGGSSPVAAAGRPAVVMPDLWEPTPASSTQAWTADFASNTPEVPSALGSVSADLTDLDFSAALAPAKASPPLPREADIAAITASIAEPAEEPAPTQDDDGSASMGEKMRQAVLSGCQDDLKRLFDQCSKPAQMKTADPDRVKAFAAFDEIFGGSSGGGEAQQQDASPKLEGEATAAQVTSATPQQHQQQQEPLVQKSHADSDFSSLLQEMTSLGLAASLAPAASSSAPPFPAAAVPAAAQVPAAAVPAAAVPAAAQGSSDMLSQQKLAQLMPQGMAGKLTPGQLEQMSPQDLLQMQMMISSALQARTPQQPAGATAVPSPPPWQTAAALSQHSSGSAPDIDWGVTDTSAQFGELVDMFQQKKS